MIPPRRALYHYTCHHGRAALGDVGEVVPLALWNPIATRALLKLDPQWGEPFARISWFTDLDIAVANALGLTRETIECDRTRYRYRVTDDHGVEPFLETDYKYTLSPLMRSSGALPRHWFVAAIPIPVEYAPHD